MIHICISSSYQRFSHVLTFSLVPLAPVESALSLPARSTRLILLTCKSREKTVKESQGKTQTHCRLTRHSKSTSDEGKAFTMLCRTLLKPPHDRWYPTYTLRLLGYRGFSSTFPTAHSSDLRLNFVKHCVWGCSLNRSAGLFYNSRCPNVDLKPH